MLIAGDNCSGASTDKQCLSFVIVKFEFVGIHPSLDMLDTRLCLIRVPKSAGWAELKSCVPSENLWRSERDWWTMREMYSTVLQTAFPSDWNFSLTQGSSTSWSHVSVMISASSLLSKMKS